MGVKSTHLQVAQVVHPVQLACDLVVVVLVVEDESDHHPAEVAATYTSFTRYTVHVYVHV